MVGGDDVRVPVVLAGVGVEPRRKRDGGEARRRDERGGGAAGRIGVLAVVLAHEHDAV